MKKVILIIIIFSSCDAKYTYVEHVKDPDLIGSGYTYKDRDPKPFEAANDIQAYSEAYKDFCISKKVYVDMSESGYGSGLAIPESFQILNDKQQDISTSIDFLIKDSIEKSLDKSIGELKSSIKESLGKAQIKDSNVSTESCPVKILSAKPEEQEYSNYKDIRLSWKNVSKKTISGIKFSWEGINAFGEPADMSYSGGFSDDKLRSGKIQSATWDLLSKDLKKVTNAWVYQVQFEDGTKWESYKAPVSINQ